MSWSRYGIAGTVRYQMVDIYGAFTIDRITNLPSSLEATFDATATGATISADALLTDRILISVRLDHLDAGGLRSLRKGYSIVGMQVKYYLRSNISF